MLRTIGPRLKLCSSSLGKFVRRRTSTTLTAVEFALVADAGLRGSALRFGNVLADLASHFTSTTRSLTIGREVGATRAGGRALMLDLGGLDAGMAGQMVDPLEWDPGCDTRQLPPCP